MAHPTVIKLLSNSADDNWVEDPYGTAVGFISAALELGLDDGVSGAMSEAEHDTLVHLAMELKARDPKVEIDPRVA
jgi:hypothetical protein